MVDRQPCGEDEASAPVPPAHGEDQRAGASDASEVADTTPTPAEQAQINQDRALASGEENVV